MRMDRRNFLAGLTGSLVSVSARGAMTLPDAQQYDPQAAAPPPVQLKTCWLDICAPFIVEDPKLKLRTEILLTATCFPGIDGYRQANYSTEYLIEIFDPQGRAIPLRESGKIVIPAMRPRLLRLGELIGKKKFWGAARIRLAPSGPKQVTHAGDLFSAGFVRWQLPGNFDNVHAHPAAPQQMTGRFFYSMPFPALDEYHCAIALFNPNDQESAGEIKLADSRGTTVVARPYKLAPHQSMLYRLGDLKTVDTPEEALRIVPAPGHAVRRGGVLRVANDSDAVAYAYTLMKGRTGESFSVEHPLHFADRPVKAGRTSPYGPNKNFPAEAFLFTPLLFSGRRLAGLDLESRLYLSASRWREEWLWLMPFVTDENGMIAWVSNRDEKFSERVEPAAHVDQGLIRLGEFQCCRLEAGKMPLPEGFGGGFGVATLPPTSHSLNKVEVRAREWGRVAFTHFRPGGQFHKKYRAAAERGGLATDYIVSGCEVRGSAVARKQDAVLAVMNIEFEEERAGSPRVQLFGAAGLVAEKALGAYPPLACRHLVLSELFPDLQTAKGEPLTLRMLDENAMMVVSVLHIDYERRDLALEHGSDRHSTWGDFRC